MYRITGVYYLDRSGTLSSGDVNTAITAVGVFTKVEIGTAVTSLGNDSFRNRFDLTDIIFRDIANSNCISTGSRAINQCSSLVNLIFPPTLTTLAIENPAYLAKYISSDPLPDSLITTGNNPFYGCPKITAVRIKSKLATLAQNAFGLNITLTSLTFDASAPLTIIKYRSFKGCALSSVAIPIKITTIENEAFQNNPFTDVQLGVGLTSIGDNCFNSVIITQVLWDAGSARTCSIGTNAFVSTGMTAYNGDKL